MDCPALIRNLWQALSVKIEENCEAPSAEDLKLLCSLLEFLNSKKLSENVLCFSGGARPSSEELGLDRPDHVDSFIAVDLLNLCHGVVHLLLHKSHAAEKDSENDSLFESMHKIILQCCKISSQCRHFILEFSLINLEAFSEACRKGHAINEQKIRDFVSVKMKKCCHVSAMPVSTVLRLLHCLIQQQQQLNTCDEEGNITDSDRLMDALLQLLTCGADDTVTAVVSQIVSMCLDRDQNKMKLWQRMKEHSEENNGSTTPYAVISFLLKKFLGGQNSQFDIRNDKNFTCFVQNGLLHPDSLTRKRAVYILKCLVDFSAKQNEQSVIPSLNLNSFILLMETLEEKQLHVMLPVLSSVQELVELCTANSSGVTHLHVSWLITALSRAFHHDNRYVTKWAVETTLLLDVKNTRLLDDENWKFITGPLLLSLEECHLYDKDSISDQTFSVPIAKMLKEFFIKCAKSGIQTEKINRVFKEVILSVCKKKLNAVAFSYIAEALCCIEIPGIVDREVLNAMKAYLLSDISMFPSELKAAAHFLFTEIALNCFDVRTLCWDDLTGFLKVIFGKGYITYGSKLWISTRNKITKCFSNINLFNSSSDEEKIECLANEALKSYLSYQDNDDAKSADEIVFVILCAVDVACDQMQVKIEVISKIESILEPLIYILGRIGRNPYLSTGEICRSLEVLSLLIRKCTECRNALKQLGNTQTISDCVLESLIKFAKPCLQYIRRMVSNVFNGDEIDDNIKVSCLNIQSTLFSSHLKDPEASVFIKHCSEMIDLCSRVFAKISQCEVDDRTELALQLLNTTANFISTNKDKLNNIESLEDKLVSIVKELSLSSNLHPDLRSLWSLVNFALKKETIIDQLTENADAKIPEARTDNVVCLASCDLAQLTRCIINTLDISVGKDIVPLLECLETLIPSVFSLDEDLALDVVHASWRIFMEQKRRDTTFWTIFYPVVKIIFCECLLLSGKVEEKGRVVDVLRNYWKKLEEIGEAKLNAFNVVLEHCCGVWKNRLILEYNASSLAAANSASSFVASEARNSILNFLDLLVDACLFGKLQKKTARITLQTINHFKLNYVEECIASNNSNRDYEVRTAAIRLFSCLDLGLSYNCELVCKFIEMLLEKDAEISDKSRRYYSNSLTHRQKLRVWQTVLVLQQFIQRGDVAGSLLTKALKLISNDNQPSIRYCIEWFVMLLVRKFPRLRSLVWEKLEQATEKHAANVTSIISVVGHLATIASTEEFSRMCAEAFVKLLPWIQVHHMQVRINAQAVVWKLWQEAKKRNSTDVVNQFGIVESLFTLKESNASVVRGRNEIGSNFYYKHFHPLRHYSLETIFINLPKLSGVADDELLDAGQIGKLFGVDQTSFSELKVHDLHPSLAHQSIQKETHKQEQNVAKEEEPISPRIDVQKKITTFKSLPPTDDPFLQKADMFKSQSKQNKLILCASLIDRVPNLGGLCRTCEIFGVSTLTVGALRYLDDSSFKSLSVSAEKWLNIEQVLPRHLTGYLQRVKAKGYRLVGVEQTANSKQLQNYEFQDNILLLLGSEREGIPVDLIQLLDDCVEIPQQGIIRSLNVHVSGAITIWEYCKQLLAKEGGISEEFL
eukprot:gene20218-22194_t